MNITLIFLNISNNARIGQNVSENKQISSFRLVVVRFYVY